VLRTFRGVSPRIHPTAFIDDSAQVIGDVEIGEESGIWMCAVVRGDVNAIRVGRRTNIQDGTVVHAMLPVPGCDIYHPHAGVAAEPEAVVVVSVAGEPPRHRVEALSADSTRSGSRRTTCTTSRIGG